MTDYGPRHRESYEEEKADYFYTIERLPGLYPYSCTFKGPYSYKASSKEQVMDDVVLEKFPAKLASGVALPVNPMTHRKVETKKKLSVMNYTYKTSTATYKYSGESDIVKQAQGAGLSLYDESVDTTVQRSATLKAYAAVDSAEVKILGTLAELADTRTMLVSAVKNIGKIGKKLRDLTKTLNEMEIMPENRQDLLTTAENTWMSVRMGWYPFWGDCQNIYNAITKAERPVWQTFRGVDCVSRSKTANRILTPAYPFKNNVTDTESMTVTAKTTILCERRASGFPDTFGLTQIPQTLYDLMPLSWAVDYIFNFGDLIAANMPDAYWTPIRVSGVTRREHKIVSAVSSMIQPPPHTGYSGGFIGGSCEYKNSSYVRRSDPPRAGILTSLELNWEKFIDLAIVGRQQFSNIRNKLFKTVHRSNRKTRRIFNA